MKTNRTIAVRVIVGLVLVVAVVAVVWRGSRSSHIAGTGTDSAKAFRNGTTPRSESTAGELPEASSSTLASAAKIEIAPFLRELTAALESLGTEPDTLEREKKLNDLAERIAAVDVPTAIEFLHERSSQGAVRYFTLRLIHRWAESDPQALANWVEQKPTSPVRREALNNVATAWANKDLESAVAWARHLTDEDESRSGLMKIAYEAARTEPIEALRLAVEMSSNEVRDDLIAHAVNQWATQDPKAALSWVTEAIDPALQQRLLTDIATTWADNSPVDAATMAVKSMSPGKQQDDAVVAIVQRWMQKQPEQAAAWVVQFPEGNLRDAGLETVVKLWADKDLAEAGNWLNSFSSSSPGRDAAVAAYVEKLATQSPEAAVEWAKEIHSETLRNEQLENLGELWLRNDAVSARAWISQAPLPDSTRARLLAPLQ